MFQSKLLSLSSRSLKPATMSRTTLAQDGERVRAPQLLTSCSPFCKANRFASSSIMLLGEWNVDISARTVSNRLNAEGLPSWCGSKAEAFAWSCVNSPCLGDDKMPLSTVAVAADRLYERTWKSKFRLFPTDGRVRMWRPLTRSTALPMQSTPFRIEEDLYTMFGPRPPETANLSS